MSKKQQKFELVSHDMWGVKVFDHTPGCKCLVHITVAPQGVVCDKCETDTCPHVQYILKHSELQKTFEQKRKQKWNIPDPT
jgi:hypothetical protein